jgi:hypothetical protein
MLMEGKYSRNLVEERRESCVGPPGTSGPAIVVTGQRAEDATLIMGGATAEHSGPRLGEAPVVRRGRTLRVEEIRRPTAITQGTVVRSRFDQPYPKRGPGC